MRKILNLAWNDIRVYFSEPSTLIFFLVLPVVFTAVIGASIGDGGEEADTRIPVLVVDEDNSSLSQELGDVLRESEVTRPFFHEREKAEGLFEEENLPALLLIPEGFSKNLREGKGTELTLQKAPDDNRTLAVDRVVQGAATQVSSAVRAALISVEEAERVQDFASPDARLAYFQSSLKMAQKIVQNPPARVETTQVAQSQTQSIGGFEQSSPGNLVTWVLITLLGASEVFVNERLGGTLRRLVATPTRQATILAGKITGRLAMGILQMVLLIGVGALGFGVDWGKSPAALALVVLAFGLAAVALGVTLGTFAQTRGQATGLTIFFAMMLGSLGGAWWPLEITPEAFQTVAKVLPSTWAMFGFQDVIVRGQGLSGVLPEAGILLGYAVVFFMIGIWRFEIE